MRDSTSVGPPAGKLLMYLTGLFGQSVSARATPEAIMGAARHHRRGPARGGAAGRISSCRMFL